MKHPNTKAWICDQMEKRGIKSAAKRFELRRRFERAWGTPRVLGESMFVGAWILEQTGIFSLTAKRDDLLMWAHYADKHQGICVGFDTTYWPFNLALPVQYSETYPVIDRAVESDRQSLEKSLLTKGSCWRYEAEWRLLMRTLNSGDRARCAGRTSDVAEWTLRQRGPGLYEIPILSISEIVFGLRVEDSQKQRLVSQLASTAGHVKFFEARRSASEFKLELGELRTGGR
jgi:hypothetical protein